MFGVFELFLWDMFYMLFLRFSQLFLHGAQVAGAQACSLRRLHTRLLLPNLPACCPPATAAPGAGGALCRAMCWQVSASVSAGRPQECHWASNGSRGGCAT